MHAEAWEVSQEQFETSAWPRGDRNRKNKQQRHLLETLVESQVIPRLLLAHHVETPTAAPEDGSAEGLAGHVGELSELVVRDGSEAAISFIRNLRKNGGSLEALFQDLLAPTARRLGELWTEDINDFTDVTRGMSHLHVIVHTFSDDLMHEVKAPTDDRRALLIPLPSEQHTFGVSLVGEHFRRSNWRVWSGPPRSTNEIFQLVEGKWFDVIGLSASKLADPKSLARDIRKLRKTSLNKNAAVLVGGFVFSDQPKLAALVGADATANDGRQAIGLLNGA